MIPMTDLVPLFAFTQIPLIDKHPRRDKALKTEIKAENKRCRIVGYQTAETVRYKERSTIERVNGLTRKQKHKQENTTGLFFCVQIQR